MKEIQTIIIEIAQEIELVNSNTEKEFLNIGEEIFYINSSSKKISSNLNSIVEALSSDIFTSSMELIDQSSRVIIFNIKQSLQDFHNILKHLSSIQNMLFRNNNDLDVFNDINNKLNVIGVTIKIESARMGIQGEEFLNLADNIHKLSYTINQKMKNIWEKNQDLNDFVERLQYNINNIINDLNFNNNELDIHALSYLNKFKIQNNNNLQSAKIIDLRVSEIHKNISQMVTYCQTHDIVRQQIEHIVEYLRLLSNEVEQDDNTNFNSKDYSYTNSFEMKEALVYQVCELQLNQLSNSKKSFFDSVINIIESLSQIKNQVFNLKNDLSNLTGSADNNKQGSTALEAFTKIIIPIAKSLNRNIELSNEIVETIKTINSVIIDINQFIFEVGKIKREIDILAMNSFIKSNKLGGAGATLGVLSNEIQLIATKAQKETIKITDNFKEVATFISEIINDEENIVNNKKLLNVKIDLDKIINQSKEIENTNDMINSKTQSLSNEFVQLSSKISHLSSNINVHSHFASKIDKIINELYHLTEEIAENNPNLDQFNFQDHAIMKSALSKYTMEEEREIHRKILNSSSVNGTKTQPQLQANTSTDVELFDDFTLFAEKSQSSNQNANTESSSKEQSSEFDDNIELF